MVAVGVALEVVSLVWEYLKELEDFKRAEIHAPEKPGPLLYTVGFMGIALVVAGVSGELYIDVKAEAIETGIRKANDDLLASISREAGEANKRAAEANLKRVELENRMVEIFGPRQLTPAQTADIVKRLAGLKGVKIDVYVLAPGNPHIPNDDSPEIGRAVLRILRDGGQMDADGWLSASCQGIGASNLDVSVPTNGSDRDRKIASQVLDAFHPVIEAYPEVQLQSPGDVCGKFAVLDSFKPNKRKHDAIISITIGTKIQPILTPEMLVVKEQRKP